jgi:hypothetical protein
MSAKVPPWTNVRSQRLVTPESFLPRPTESSSSSAMMKKLKVDPLSLVA